METTDNNYLIKPEVTKDRALFRSGIEDNNLIKEEINIKPTEATVSSVDKVIKKELTKSIVLFSILIIAVGIFAYINYRYESEFKREFELPGAPVEGF